MLNYDVPKPDAFLRDLDSLRERQPAFFRHGHIRAFKALKLAPTDPHKGEIEFNSIEATVRGAGWGTVALRLFVALADRHGVTVRLVVSPRLDEDGDVEFDDAVERLVNWYSKAGFVEVGKRFCGAAQMTRPQQMPSPEAEAMLNDAFAGVPISCQSAGVVKPMVGVEGDGWDEDWDNEDDDEPDEPRP